MSLDRLALSVQWVAQVEVAILVHVSSYVSVYVESECVVIGSVCQRLNKQRHIGEAEANNGSESLNGHSR